MTRLDSRIDVDIFVYLFTGDLIGLEGDVRIQIERTAISTPHLAYIVVDFLFTVDKGQGQRACNGMASTSQLMSWASWS